jgi:hypothetical protein
VTPENLEIESTIDATPPRCRPFQSSMTAIPLISAAVPPETPAAQSKVAS